uniref:Retrotransposon protein, putative, Ty1-copia subclass n=1 Tax=Tanacetum cinerariifolium TaxID=118510 RepID=A0A699GV72_TANCI|nr:retrotransposon protein, putative, Ty1-copia subclass [Tanacetum cinerariifolium]
MVLGIAPAGIIDRHLPLSAPSLADQLMQFENYSPYEMLQELKSMFKKQARVERFDLIQTFHACKQEKGKPVALYVLQMKGYVDQLERLGYMLPQDLIVGLILNGLTKYSARFVRNYNMHNMGKTIGELHAMLIEYEKCLPKKAETPQVMIIKGGKVQKSKKKSIKANGKGNDKQVYIPTPKNLKPSAKEHPAKDGIDHRFKEFSRGLQKQGNRNKEHSICTWAMVSIVSVRRLVENGFVQCLMDFGISVSKNNAFYFNANPSNVIYEIDMHDLVPNVNSIYNVSTKRVKHNLDSTYLWHCRLAHISKKCIEKLQQEGLLRSTDDESFDACVSCLSGKITKKSFPRRPKRATDLIGIIHTDVCGPLRHVSRQGASYFITFTVDYSRYGYVYLLKHKHKLTHPYTPRHNGVSERKNRTLLDTVRSMMNLTTLSLSFWDYALGSATRILNMVPTNKVDKTPYELCGRAVDLVEIQDKDTSPSENTREIPIKVEEVEEHSLRDLNEPTSYKAAMVDSKSNKWIDDMNAKIQSMIYNMVWVLVDLPPGCKTIGSKWIFKKKTDMDGVYQKASGSNVTFLILYVDDTIIMGNHTLSLQSVKDYLEKCFAMKDLREAAFILGIKIYRDRSKRLIGLGQNAYMDKILKRCKMDNSKRGHISMQEKIDLNKTQGDSTPKEVKRMQDVPYASAVSSIMYAVRCTRPDVAFAQNIMSQFQQNPGELHWTAMKNILKYLKNTKDMFLFYGGNPKAELRVDCYCDVGFETDGDDTKSQTRYVFILNGGTVDWKSSKQSTTAMSATKAEYIAALKAAMEAVWIRKFISELGIVPTINEPIKMYCDNSAALHFANEP